MTEAFGEWSPERPNTLVIACSDGRLQEATDEFLAHHLQVTRYDRFDVPGGAGALAAVSSVSRIWPTHAEGRRA